MFPDNNENALLDMWDKIEKKPVQVFNISLNAEVDAYHRDVMVFHMMTFLKLFATHKYKFERSLGALIVFSDVNFKSIVTLLIFSWEITLFLFIFRTPRLIQKS